MFADRKQFLDYLENVCPDDIKHEYGLSSVEKPTFKDLYFIEEKVRCETIKALVSSDHDWQRGTITDERGFVRDIFQCDKCYLKASIFNYAGCLPIIRKINDGVPSYDAHNEYIMYSCDFIASYVRDNPQTHFCDDCGMPGKLCSLCYLDLDE